MPSVPPPAPRSADPPAGEHRASERPPGARSAPPHPPGERFDDSTGAAVWTAPAAVVVGLFFGVLATFVVALVGHSFGSSLSHPSPAVSLVGDYVFDLAFVAAALYFALLGGARPRPASFGFRRLPARRAALAFVAAGVAYYALTAAYSVVVNPHGSDRLPSELGVNRYTAALVAASVFVCVFAPIVEEFFFRGFLFGTLARMRVGLGRIDAGPWLAAVIVAVLFGLAHAGSAPAGDLVPLGFLGFLLCLVRWRTGSLYPCIALHSFNNCVALGVQQGWSGGEVLGALAGSAAVIALLTGPLSRRRRGW
jgi:membrane protease YdiL (CAAX protease family)